MRATIWLDSPGKGVQGIVSVVPRTAELPAETLRLAVAAVSDAAGRDENQDIALAIVLGSAAATSGGEDFLLVVADGMGGEPAGDVASQIAARTLRDAFPELPEGDLGQALKQAYRQANDAVVRAGAAEPAYAGMGTTLTSALIHGKYATIANVGDSRAYLLRGEGLTQITRDHTFVAEEVAKGRISADAVKNHPRRNILTNTIGTSPKLDSKLPNIFELTLLPGDRLLLCSDGLYDPLDEVDIRRALLGQEPAVAASALVALAKERGTRDNASAVVATAMPTRVPVVGTLPVDASRTGGIPGTAVAVAMAVLLLIVMILAVYLLVMQR